MNEDDLLNFNYPIQASPQIQAEREIKERLRSKSLNLGEMREIERYSDKYMSATSKQEIERGINVEILSPELQRSYGMYSGVEAETVVDDIDENEDEKEQVEEQSGENESLEGGDDYMDNYYEEDEFVDERGNQEDVL